MFYLLNLVFPVPEDMAQYDDVDVYGTFTSTEARRLGIIPLDESSSVIGITTDVGRRSDENVEIDAEGK